MTSSSEEETSDTDKKTVISSSADSTVPSLDPHEQGAATNLRRRGANLPLVTRHRQALDRLLQDSVQGRRHPVPHRAGSSTADLHENSNHNDPSLSSQTSTWISGLRRQYQKQTEDLHWLEVMLPCSRWLKSYRWKEALGADIVAGLTVGVMVLPQSMSYAKLAGLPVEYGLYSALFPIYSYAIFGSSRQLAVGPVALISLMLKTGLTDVLKNQGFEEGVTPEYQQVYNRLAIEASFLVGVSYILMGLARLGFVTIFLSHAVISGFTTGAAVIIGSSQVKYILGYDISSSKRLHELLKNIFKGIDQFNWKTFVIGSLSILALIFLKNIGKTYPKLKWVRALGPLAVTAITIILTVAFRLDEKGIPIVGNIPSGLPSFTADEWFPIPHFDKLFVVVAGIVIVGFMESIAIAKQLASKHKYEIDSSQELIGLGMSNLAGAMFQAYPVTGSFSRSAVNNESGAKSGISGMVTATLVAFSLLLLTPVFEQLPTAVLGAIVISGVIGLIDYPEAINLWKVHKFDFGVWVTACFGTMFLGVEIGLAIAVGVSLLIVIYESAYPHTSVMGRLPGSTVYRNVKQYREAETYDGIVIVRIDGALFFANAQNVRDKVRKYRLQAQQELDERNGTVRFLILEMSPVARIDTSAMHILEDMYKTYLERGQQICFANPSLLVMNRFIDSGFVDLVGAEHFFSCNHDAVNWCLNEMDSEALSQAASENAMDSSGDEETGSHL